VSTRRTALLLIAHGSRRAEANADLDHLAAAMRQRGRYPVVQVAFLELAEPGIEAGGALCVERGATDVSGDIGRHGIAIMASREGLAFESQIESDSAPVADLVMNLLDAGIRVHCLRDLTRGGLATALVEIAQASRQHLHINEAAVPVREDVRGACEILGLDPLYVANEGRFIAIIESADAQRALEIFGQHPLGGDATTVGSVTDQDPGRVTLTSLIGVNRIVDMLSGEQLPRIC
jgi:hydrogenase expression/formation protein HypE